MNIRAPRTLALAGALPLLTGALALLPGTVTAPAGAACAPSQSIAQRHAHAAAKVKVSRSATMVTKRHKHAYVARIRLTATQGSATVRLVTGICPDGTAGAAASTTQTASGRGVTHRSVSGKGRTAAAARKDAKRAAARATAALKRAGVSKRARHRAEKRAVAVARAAAARKAHDALYLSDVVYAVVGADDVYRLSPTPPAGEVRLTRAASGDLVLSVPAGFRRQDASSKPCVRRAPAWPRTSVFDGGDVVAPALRAAAGATSGSTFIGIESWTYPNLQGVPSAKVTTGEQSWAAGWTSGTNPPQYSAGFIPDTPDANPLVCFTTDWDVANAYTAVLHGARVGTSIRAGSFPYRVSGGIPVALR